MITVEYKKSLYKVELIVKGHSEWNKIGRDIVCAGVSALISTLVMHFAGDGCNETGLFFELEDGYAEISTYDSELVEHFEFVLTGLKAIAKAYPKNVKVHCTNIL